MDTWIDLSKEFPNLRGYFIHVLDITAEDLEKRLVKLGFAVYRINGAKVFDEHTLFKEVAGALKFPGDFGDNWAAWDDSLGEFYASAPRRIAILWEHATETYSSDTQTFLQAVCDLNNLASASIIEVRKKSGKERQMEVFILK